MFLYLIVGRTASGKSNLAHLLNNNGLRRVISSTTRPKRKNETEKDYHFVNKVPDNTIAKTKINNFTYFITPDDLKNKDFYIIDPDGVIELAKKMPDAVLHIIYLNNDQNQRKKHFIQRALLNGLTHTEAINAYNQRNSAEDKRFTEFEKVIKSKKPYAITDSKYALPKNVFAISNLNIDYDNPNAALNDANNLTVNKTIRTRLAQIVNKAPELGLIKRSPDGKLIATLGDAKKQSHQIELTPDQYTAYLLNNTGAFSLFITQIIAHDSDLNKIYPPIE